MSRFSCTALALGSMLVACATGPGLEFDSLTAPVTVELQVGQSVQVGDVTITVQDLVATSGCTPSGWAVCPAEALGNGEAEFGVSFGPTLGPDVAFRLSTARDPRSRSLGSMTLTLDGVYPRPGTRSLRPRYCVARITLVANPMLF